MITLCFFALNGFAQMNANQHNPYLTNSEVHKLRVMKIDLFSQPFNNEQFQQDLKLTLKSQKEFHKSKRNLGAVGAFSAIAILTGIGGMIFDLEPENKVAGTAIGLDGEVKRTPPLASHYAVIGYVGVVSSLFTIKLNKDKNKSKKAYLDQLKKTRGQYDVLKN